MLSERMRQQLIDAFYAQDELYGCVIGSYGDGMCSVLSAGMVPSINWGRIAGVVEQTTLDDIPAELQQSHEGPSVDLQKPPDVITNKSRVTREVLGAGLSCGLTVISGIGVFGSAAAEVPTAGGSTVVLVLAWTGFVTSGIQCLNGIARVREVYNSPDDNSLQRWDDNKIYSTAFLIVDIIGVASAVAGIPLAAKNLIAVLQRRGGLMAADEFARLSAAERKIAIQNALKQATKTPEGAAEVEQALKTAGLSGKQATQALNNGAKTARRVKVIASAISKVTAQRLNNQILSIVGSGLTPAVSATPSQITGSASGSINTLVIHIFNLA